MMKVDKDSRPYYLSGFHWTAMYARARDYRKELFHVCCQPNIRTWRTEKAIDLSNPVKLGEGTFGEVFLVKFEAKTVALKIIPVGGKKLINGDRQKTFREIVAELIVSKELSDLNRYEDGFSTEGFIRLMGTAVVKGIYPKTLVKAWEEYDEQYKSENEHP
ncbi:unnamed protein product, partial [Gongylonema pulchrum]|uniref:Protein kinase domain-containing protein n=1 Tax=Gongylonema pulchrum TaxID=637853 RepID=A0A183ESX4_9BILA